MAKTIIQTSDSRHSNPDMPVEVHVGWLQGGGNGQVTVGTVLPGAGLIGRDGIELSGVVSPGWFANLDEQGCDDLIEALTHARRKTWGRPQGLRIGDSRRRAADRGLVEPGTGDPYVETTDPE